MNKNKPIPKAQVRKTAHGWQVYAAGPKGHIAQGQPHKDLGTAKRDAKKFEEVEVDEGPPTPKFKPLKHKVWSADASIPAGARPKDPGPIPKYKVSKKTGMGYGTPTNEDKKKTKAEKKKELFKSRKFRFTTPGQDRDFETLDANRMFKSYEAKEIEVEDVPTTSTAGVANWNPLLSGRKRKVDVYMKKRRKVDGRTKDYKETVTRLQTRRDASVARELEQKLNMFGVQSNPFKEDTEMENKKYLKTKEGSIESAVLKSVTVETPVNPNDARPTLHLPKKYFSSLEGSLESAVTSVLTKEDKLSYKERQGLAKSQFALPGKGSGPEGKQGGSYPIPDESHARNALARVSQHGSEAEKATVRRAVERKFPNIKIGEAKDPQTSKDEPTPEDAYDYKAKKGAIAAPGSGSIAKAKKAKVSDVNKSIEQQMADARKEEVEMKEGEWADEKRKEKESSDRLLKIHIEREKRYQAQQAKKKQAQEEVEMDEAGATKKQVKMAKGIAWDKRHRGGDMTGAWKKAEKIKKGLGDHPTVQKALKRANEEDDRGVGSQAYTDYIRNLTPGETAVKDPEAKKASSASKQAAAEKKRQITKIDDAVDPEVVAAKVTYKKGSQDMKKQHILDVAKIKASKVGEEIIVGLLDMGIIKIDENKETGFTVINDPVANRENLLRMAYHTGAKILNELNQKQMPTKKIPDKLKPKSLIPPNKSIPEKGPKQGQLEAHVSSDDYDHATALYKDQWKDRKIADYDKEHDRDSRAKEMRKDAEVDRKRMWGLTGDKWKHAKGASGEEKGKKSEVGNPDPKDAYKKEDVQMKGASFSGTPNTTHDPKFGQSIAIDPLEDKERVRKLPKGATTKATQKKQREFGQKVGGAPKGSTGDIPGAKPHKPNVGVTKEEVVDNSLVQQAALAITVNKKMY